MDTKELIEQGDLLFKSGKFEEAYSYYHKAHMQNDPYGTYMLAECFRIAFHMQNLDSINYGKCITYAKSAIDLYSIAYKQLGYNDILMKKMFVQRLTNDSKCDLPEESLVMQNFQENAKEYQYFPHDKFAMFLSADIHSNAMLLLQLAHDEKAEKYLRIAASAMAYKHSSSYTLHKREADAIIDGLLDANKLGAKFNIINMNSRLQIDSRNDRAKNNILPDFWSDVACPRWYGELASTPYEIGSYSDAEGFCDNDGFYCSLDDYYDNNYDDK